jgi:uncharacterized membrane protein
MTDVERKLIMRRLKLMAVWVAAGAVTGLVAPNLVSLVREIIRVEGLKTSLFYFSVGFVLSLVVSFYMKKRKCR